MLLLHQSARSSARSSPIEHGFAAFWPEGDGIGIAWLDGRETSGGHEGHGGAMTLRSAAMHGQAVSADADAIDARTCDCWCDGKMSMIRLTEDTAEFVCRVAKVK